MIETQMTETDIPDYYEFLSQLEPQERFIITGIWRPGIILITPDGDLEEFSNCRSGLEFSGPARRAEYIQHGESARDSKPAVSSIDFADQGWKGITTAVWRFLPSSITAGAFIPMTRSMLSEIERRMGFPRDYLDFTTWYLAKKKFITKADNAEFTLTVEGVDFIETQRATVPLLVQRPPTVKPRKTRNQLPTGAYRISSSDMEHSAGNFGW